MAISREDDIALARQARTAAAVIAVAMVVWVAAQWVGPALGLAGKYAFLIDLSAIAAFIWSLVVVMRVRQRRRVLDGR